MQQTIDFIGFVKCKNMTKGGFGFDMVNQIVRHFKGDLYLILNICTHTETETGEEHVVYKSLYESGKVWVRPLSIFQEEVPKEKENPTKQKFRFELFEPKRISSHVVGD